MRIALIALSSAGLVVSFLFMLMKKEPTFAAGSWLPRACRIDEGTCRTILEAPEARLFGISNFWIGGAYYLAILALSANAWIDVPPTLIRWAFVASMAASATGIILAYALIRNLKTSCPLCFFSHAVNIAITMLLYYNL